MPNVETLPEIRNGAIAPAGAHKGQLPASFRQNFAWMLAANVVYAACQWAMLMVLAKNCRTSQVGIFALGLAVTAPVVMLANLQLRALQVTDVRGLYSFREYLWLRFATTALGLALMLLLALLPSRGGEARLVIAVFAIAKSIDSVSDILQGYLQQQERMMQVAGSLLLKGTISLTLVFLAVRRWPTATAAAAAMLAGSLITLVVYDWPTAKRFQVLLDQSSGPISRNRLQALARRAVPLGIVQGLVSLSSNIPRYYLEQFAGPADLGVYSALASLIVVGQTAVNALGQVASPRLALRYAEGGIHAFRLLLLKLTGLGALVGVAMVVGAAVIGRPVLKLLFRPEYAAHTDLLVLLTAAGAVAYVAWLAGFGLTAAQCFRPQIPLLVAVCAAAWAGSALWIPGQHSHGAAFALMLSMAVQLGGAIFILAKLCGPRARFWTDHTPEVLGHA